MRFAFIRPSHYSKWAGDIKALLDLSQGLENFGHNSRITSDLFEAHSFDRIFLISTLVDHTPAMTFMQWMQKEYGVIPFQEDHLLFSGACFGFYYYISSILSGAQENGFLFSLEDLFERPHLIFYFDRIRPQYALQNYEVLKNATHVIASSHKEQKTLFRDAPGCKAKVVYWAAGHTSGLKEDPTDAFLHFTGLKSGEYILQVGRLSPRKNQIATLLAAKDFDVPLVFIAMDFCNPTYEKLFFATALRWRKGPTILISQHLSKADSQGPIRVIPAPNGEILSKEMLLSAFVHSGLHMHPAFYELPGYTYLESIRFGIPTIATEWCSLKDYFTDFSAKNHVIDDCVEYVLPYDIPAIKNLLNKKFGKKHP
ncbi:MAG: hypothetical protein HY324_01180, partial [Chlamydiia bacterium]|nr:hypothetical protein [Chlamydiia bacterium]